MRIEVEIPRDKDEGLSIYSIRPKLKYSVELQWETNEYSTLETYLTIETIRNACDVSGLSYLIGSDVTKTPPDDGSKILTLFHIYGQNIHGALELHCRDEHVYLLRGEPHRHEFLLSVISTEIPDLVPIGEAKMYDILFENKERS